MNKLISFVILLITFSLSVWAAGPYEEFDEGNEVTSCSDTGFNFSDLTSVAASQCLKKGFVITKCKCIYKEMQARPNASMEAEQGYRDYMKEFEIQRKPYIEKFDKVYEKVTIQAAAQEEVLGISDNSKPVGCTPIDLAEGIRKKKIISIPTQVEALIKIRDTAITQESECGEGKVINLALNAHGCDYYKTRVEVLTNRIEAMKSGPENCKLVVDVLNVKDTQDKLDEIELFLASKSGNKKSMGQKALDELDELKSRIQKKEKVNPKECYGLMEKYIVMTEFHKKQVAKDVEGGDLIPETDGPRSCLPDDKECNRFTKQNEDLLNKTAKLYEIQKKECVTYAEYSTYKGMPSHALLEQFANNKNPEDLLKNTTTYKDARNFIKANPLIAVVARNGDPVELGKKLKEMAKNILKSKEKGVGANFRGYLDFMTGNGDFKDDGGFKKIYNKDKKASNMAVCDELQRYYTAVELSDDIPEVKNQVASDPLEQTNGLVKQCIGRVYKGTSTTNLDSTLELSPISDLGSELDDEPSKDGYEKFKNDYCKGFDEHVASNSDCKNGNSKKCRGSFKANTVSEINEITHEYNTKDGFTSENLKNIASTTNPTKQDHEYKRWWQRSVGDKLDNHVLMSNDDDGEYVASAQNNHSLTSSPDIQSRYEHFQNPDAPAFSSGIAETGISGTTGTNIEEKGFTRSTEDKNHVRPDFNAEQKSNPPITNFSSVPPEKIKNATDMTQIDPTFNARTDEEKLTSYKALKNFVDEGGTAPAFNPTEEIEKIAATEKIVSTENKSDESDKTKVQNVGQVGRTLANNVQSNFNAPISNAPVLGQFPRATTGSSRDKVDKGKASYEKALLNMGTGQIFIQEGYAEGPYEVAKSNILTADGADGDYPFEDLSKPDKLSEFLANRLGNKINNGDSVMIKKPGTEDYFVVKATKENGITSYQLIPFVPKEEIKLYSNLKNIFKNIK